MTQQRAVHLLAGSLVLAGVALGAWINHWWLLLTAFAGIGLLVDGLTGICLAGLLMGKLGFKDTTRPSISPREVHNLQCGGTPIDLIDVRTHKEFDACHAVGAQLVPLSELTQDAVQSGRKAPGESPLYVICQTGGRSAMACDRLARMGIKAVNVDGGTAAWRKAGLPVETN